MLFLVGTAPGSGIILEKENPWGAAAYATPFSSILSRGEFDSGYKTYFTDRFGKRASIDTNLIAEIIGFVDLDGFGDIIDDASLRPLLLERARLAAVVSKAPVANQFIAPRLAALDAEIGKFRSGLVKVSDRWRSAKEYNQFMTARAEAQAAEDRRIADEKAAEQKKAEDRAAAERKEAEDRGAIERKEAEDRAAAERKEAEDQLEAEDSEAAKKAASQAEAEEKEAVLAKTQKAIRHAQEHYGSSAEEMAEEEKEAKRAADQAGAEKRKAVLVQWRRDKANTSDAMLTDPAARSDAIAEFRKQVNAIISKASPELTAFKAASSLNEVSQLSFGLAAEVRQMSKSARVFRKSVGYALALRECRVETRILDALATLDTATRDLKSGDAESAMKQLNQFHQNDPGDPPVLLQPLYEALTNLGTLSSDLQRESQIHADRARTLAAAGKIEEALKEGKRAYDILPDPKIARMIEEIREQSLGL